MKTTTQTMTARPRLLIILALATLTTLAMLSGTMVQAGTIAFKLDPRLTASLYMGDRWVSPTSYTQLQNGAQMKVVAMSSSPVDWVPADAGMVTVAPEFGSVVTITINHAGETTLTAGGSTLAIKATQLGDGSSLKVEISQ